MTTLILMGMSAVAGGLVGSTIGIDRYRARLRRAARGAPGDQVALATLERIALHDQHRK